MVDAVKQENKDGGPELNMGKDRVARVTFGDVQADITPDGNVKVYTDEAFQAKPADAVAAETAPVAGDSNITIKQDFSYVAVYGAKIEQTAAGFVVSTNGKAQNAPVPDTGVLKPGDAAADGWIYVDNLPESGLPLFVAPEDAGTMTLRQAKKTANATRKKGKTDAHLPSESEAALITGRKDLVNGLKDRSLDKYWSSSEFVIPRPPKGTYMWGMAPTRAGLSTCWSFSSGRKMTEGSANKNNVRLVRTGTQAELTKPKLN